MSYLDAIASIKPLDQSAVQAATERQGILLKPAGALGQIEDVGIQLCAIAGVCPPPIPAKPVVAIFAADHGVARSGVTPWPQDITAQMVATFAQGGAAINVFARQVGAEVHVTDMGVIGDLDEVVGIDRRPVGPGTNDLSVGSAMSEAQAVAAVDTGVAVAQHLVSAGADLLVTGEMGIGNTTAAACLIAAFTGREAAEVTGRGTGVDDETLALKTNIVAGAVARTSGLEPIKVLAEVGGFEIAAMAGLIIGGAAARVPVLIDGVICNAALLVAEALAPGVSTHCIAAHLSTEPGATVALNTLDMQPLLDLNLRLGEGTGGCLTIPVVQAAARILRDMATF